MIVASFDKDQSRTAAVSGAYQYDTGQRLVMHGLPSPPEMAGEDDLLSGDLVTVQAQFSYVGDSQSDMRLAMWDEDRQVWLADVPDDYLTRHKDVHVYVYLYYGSDDMGERAETAYEATFRPISRPAPGGKVTEDQIAQWKSIKAEIEISLSKIDTALENANKAIEDANNAANGANNAANTANNAKKAANDAADELAEVTGRLATSSKRTDSLSNGTNATASIDLSSGAGSLVIGAPRGLQGPKGQKGDKGLTDIRVEYNNVTKTLTITTL